MRRGRRWFAWGATLVVTSGACSDGDEPSNALQRACTATAAAVGVERQQSDTEWLETLSELSDDLAEMDDAIEAEGTDPNGDVTRLYLAIDAFTVGAVDGDTVIFALGQLSATCDAEFAVDREVLDEREPQATTSTARSVDEEECEGASGCAYDNGIDFQDLREEIAAEVDGASPDDVDCERGDTPPNRLGPGATFECLVLDEAGVPTAVASVLVQGDGEFEFAFGDF